MRRFGSKSSGAMAAVWLTVSGLLAGCGQAPARSSTAADVNQSRDDGATPDQDERVSSEHHFADGAVRARPAGSSQKARLTKKEVLDIVAEEHLYEELADHPSKKVEFGLLTDLGRGQKRADGSTALEFTDHPAWFVTFKNVPLGPASGPAGGELRKAAATEGDVVVVVSDARAQALYAIEKERDR